MERRLLKLLKKLVLSFVGLYKVSKKAYLGILGYVLHAVHTVMSQY